jgi:hypothetical protein
MPIRPTNVEKMRDSKPPTQSQRLHGVLQGAREARLAYERGEITHQERMQRLRALTRHDGLLKRLSSWLFPAKG